MTFCFVWDTEHHKRGDQYEVVGLPKMPGKKDMNMVYMGGAGVTAKSTSPRLAWEFLHHYLVECHSWMPPFRNRNRWNED